ncbi:hypothetical protein B0H14DRAFT_2592716 [Mycena olivaceomarginata]|nr:hypothetical protein B0H14DRAFT_2592716 [Mycena olivaceomarginata]
MTYPVSDTVVLNLDFGLRVLSTHGPIVDSLVALEWQREWRPAHVKAVVSAEMSLYPFLEWVIYRPAARTLPVVLYRLFKTSSKPMPVQLARYSRTAIIDSQHEFGSTDIVHFLSQNEEDERTEEGIRALHEVKRARILTIGNLSVLGEMYRSAESGWNFRESSDCAKGFLGDQRTCTSCLPLKPIMPWSTSLATLRMSRVYPIHNEDPQNQASDMAELVLFYAHAALTRSWEPQGSLRRSHPFPSEYPFHRFHPQFSSLVKGSFTLVALLLFPQLLSLGIDGFWGHSRHDGEIVVSFVRLTFLLFEARAVAKAAYETYASQRLHPEFDVYNALCPLQGASIPTLFRLYWNHSDSSSVLITSHGGTPLRDFDTLTLGERFAPVYL